MEIFLGTIKQDLLKRLSMCAYYMALSHKDWEIHEFDWLKWILTAV